MQEWNLEHAIQSSKKLVKSIHKKHNLCNWKSEIKIKIRISTFFREFNIESRMLYRPCNLGHLIDTWQSSIDRLWWNSVTKVLIHFWFLHLQLVQGAKRLWMGWDEKVRDPMTLVPNLSWFSHVNSNFKISSCERKKMQVISWKDK